MLFNPWKTWLAKIASPRGRRVVRRSLSHRLQVEQLEDRRLLDASIDLDTASETGRLTDDDYTADNTPTFSGIAAAGSTVTVEIDDGSGFVTLGMTPADATTGAWTFTVPLAEALADNVYEFRATDGGTSLNTLVVTIDTQKPATPAPPDLNSSSDTGTSNIDNITNDTTPTFDGIAEEDSDVEVFGDSGTGNMSLGTTVLADPITGVWSFTRNPALPDDTYAVTVRATDLAGNTSDPSTALSVQIDSTLAVPSTPDLDQASDTGASGTDNNTSDDTPTFTGTAEAGSTVTVIANNGTMNITLGTTTADATTGAWMVTPTTPLADDVYTVTAQAADTSGNPPSTSGALTVTIDRTAPGTPGAADLAAASDSGSSATDNNTSDNTPTFSGTAAAGTTVEVFRNNGSGPVSLGTTAADAATGAWTLTPALANAVPDGNHNITVTATDLAGNTSPASTALAVTIDTTNPATTAAPDLTAASDTGVSNSDNITGSTTPTFSGTAEANSTVRIFSDGTQLGTTQANADGEWTFTSPTVLTDGVHAITARATDLAGNVSTASAALSITVDTSGRLANPLREVTDQTRIDKQTPHRVMRRRQRTARSDQRQPRPFLNFRQKVTITNNSGAAILDPIVMTLTGLDSRVTLRNSTGVTQSLSPSGRPLIGLDVGPDGLQVGETATVVLKFRVPKSAVMSAENSMAAFLRLLEFRARLFAGIGDL